MLLFAPGLSFRPLVQTGYILELLPRLAIGVPNFAPTNYKRFQNTPLFWYQNTLDLYSQTRDLKSADHLRSTPTIIFLNSTDELVSLPGVEAWISRNQLSESWHVIPVHRKPLAPFMAEHIVIDEQSLGHEEWEKVKETIQSFLSIEH
jgi:hypothetical protein